MCFQHCFVDFSRLCHVTADQVTFQGCDINEARHLYDHLAVMCPIMVSAMERLVNCKAYLSLFSSPNHGFAFPHDIAGSWPCRLLLPSFVGTCVTSTLDGPSSRHLWMTGQQRREGRRLALVDNFPFAMGSSLSHFNIGKCPNFLKTNDVHFRHSLTAKFCSVETQCVM